jgi:hypothetical protein
MPNRAWLPLYVPSPAGVCQYHHMLYAAAELEPLAIHIFGVESVWIDSQLLPKRKVRTSF